MEQYVVKMVNGKEDCERQPLDSIEPSCIPRKYLMICNLFEKILLFKMDRKREQTDFIHYPIYINLFL